MKCLGAFTKCLGKLFNRLEGLLNYLGRFEALCKSSEAPKKVSPSRSRPSTAARIVKCKFVTTVEQ